MQVQIKTKSKAETIAVLTLAVAMGYKRYYQTKPETVAEYVDRNHGQYPYPVIKTNENTYTLSSGSWNPPTGGKVTSSMDEVLVILAGQDKKTSVKIEGSNYTAVANKDFTGVDVGCTYVSKETVKEILDMLENKGEVK